MAQIRKTKGRKLKNRKTKNRKPKNRKTKIKGGENELESIRSRIKEIDEMKTHIMTEIHQKSDELNKIRIKINGGENENSEKLNIQYKELEKILAKLNGDYRIISIEELELKRNKDKIILKQLEETTTETTKKRYATNPQQLIKP